MADLSFLPDDFDQSSSLLHRLRRQASHLLLRSPPKPPPSSRRRPATPTRTPTEDRSFVPYIPLANRYERPVPPVRTRSRTASISSASSTERSFPTTPLNHVFPTTAPACAADEGDDHQLDLHIIRHSLSLPWLIAKERPDENGGVPLPECDPSDAIPDSPTLPPSLALPMPVPDLVLAPVVPASESVPIAASRPAPVLHIPPAPSYPPPAPSIADSDSRWDDETMVGDSETVAEFELDSAAPDPSPSRNHARSDMVTLDWTLHLSRSHPRPPRSKFIPPSSSRPVSPSVTDWTLELPAPVPVVPAAAAAPQSQGNPAPLPSPVVQSRVSQCPSSWLSPFPHTSTPPPLRKAKSAHSLLPLRPVPPHSHGSFLLSP